MLRLSGAIPLLPPVPLCPCTGQLDFSLYAVAFNFRLIFLLFWKIDGPVEARELCNKQHFFGLFFPPAWRPEFCCYSNAETWCSVEPGFCSCCCVVHVVAVITQRFSSSYDGTRICRSAKLTPCVYIKEDPCFSQLRSLHVDHICCPPTLRG
jgi:hypothetical protein